MLLIVSNKTDLATDYLVMRLHEREIPFLRLNTEDYLSTWNVNFLIENGKSDVIIQKKYQPNISINCLTGAYIRQPKLPTIEIANEDRNFAMHEVGESLKSLWRFIDDDVWLNAPHRILRASNKPEQLSVASKLGFNIPNTYIGTRYNEIEEFYKKNNKKIICKAVKHGFNFDENLARIAATQVINEQNINKINEFACLPMIFQNLIDKKYDIRVTVIGNEIFSTAIESQNNDKTKIDWRLSDCYKIPLNQYKIDLPDDINNLCFKMTKYFGLKYSAIDLVLDKTNKYYFLELNPNGQWAWLEQLHIHKIRDSIIDNLII